MNEDMLKQFFSDGRSYSISDVKKHFHIKGEDDTEKLTKLIERLEEDAFIFCSNDKYSLLSKRDDLLQGVIKINSYGDGYVEDVKISREYLDCVLDGDIVLVKKCFIDKHGKVLGNIERIIKQKDGLVIVNYQDGKLIPYKNYFRSKIKINKSKLKNIDNDSRLLVKIDPISYDGVVNGEVISVIGHKDDVYLDEKTIAIENGFDIEFSEKVKNEVNNISLNISEEEINKRTDLRNEEIFTIDCDSTKDMDDAVSLSISDDGNYILGVHIADVAYYVKPGSEIFKEASRRGTSVYINDTSIPMLDRKLSNDICSLNPLVDRYTKSISIKISKTGEVLDYYIYPSIIRSKKKMKYSEVNKILEDKESVLGYEEFEDTLNLMNELSKVLEDAKIKRGYLPFSETDVKTSYDKFGNAIDFSLNKQKSAQKLIENFMLVANECVGNYFYNMGFPAIYRVHEAPDNERLIEIFDFISNLGYKIQKIKNIDNSRAIQSILRELSKIDEYPILSNMVLKGMKRAKFSSYNIGHFGLAIDNYIQFTSPIRRFPDLEIHSILDKFSDFNISIQDLKYLEKNLEEYAMNSSYKERQADKAELEGLKMKMAEYMEGHIGEYFNGWITFISKSYVYVITDNHIEGKVSIDDIDGNFKVSSDKTKIIGSCKAEYKVGDRIRVKVVGASKEIRNVDFSIKENLSNKCLVRTRKN